MRKPGVSDVNDIACFSRPIVTSCIMSERYVHATVVLMYNGIYDSQVVLVSPVS